MKYAHIDTNNKLLGWYDKDIHNVIPTPNIEVSEEAWQVAIESGHNKVNINGTTEFQDFRTASELANERVAEIDARLKEIDIESVRPLRAISNGNQTQFDIDKLAALDTEAATLRAERLTLVTA